VVAYDAVVWPLLAANPEKYTVLLTVLARLKKLGSDAFGVQAPLLGWWPGAVGSCGAGGSPNASAARAHAAVIPPPPHAMLVTALLGTSARELAWELANRANAPCSVNGAEPDAMAFAQAWSELTSQPFRVHQRQRLHRLETLTPPDPGPGGE